MTVFEMRLLAGAERSQTDHAKDTVTGKQAVWVVRRAAVYYYGTHWALLASTGNAACSELDTEACDPALHAYETAYAAGGSRLDSRQFYAARKASLPSRWSTAPAWRSGFCHVPFGHPALRRCRPFQHRHEWCNTTGRHGNSRCRSPTNSSRRDVRSTDGRSGHAGRGRHRRGARGALW